MATCAAHGTSKTRRLFDYDVYACTGQTPGCGRYAFPSWRGPQGRCPTCQGSMSQQSGTAKVAILLCPECVPEDVQIDEGTFPEYVHLP
jgi:hypothetical protein